MRTYSPLADKKAITHEDLLDLPLICSRQSLNEEIPKWFGEMQGKLTIVVTYDLIFNTTFMVQEGLGYAIGFDKLINTETNGDLCFYPFIPQYI